MYNIHTYINIHVYICIHTYIYIYVYVYTCTHAKLPCSLRLGMLFLALAMFHWLLLQGRTKYDEDLILKVKQIAEAKQTMMDFESRLHESAKAKAKAKSAKADKAAATESKSASSSTAAGKAPPEGAPPAGAPPAGAPPAGAPPADAWNSDTYCSWRCMGKTVAVRAANFTKDQRKFDFCDWHGPVIAEKARAWGSCVRSSLTGYRKEPPKFLSFCRPCILQCLHQDTSKESCINTYIYICICCVIAFERSVKSFYLSADPVFCRACSKIETFACQAIVLSS